MRRITFAPPEGEGHGPLFARLPEPWSSIAEAIHGRIDQELGSGATFQMMCYMRRRNRMKNQFDVIDC